MDKHNTILIFVRSQVSAFTGAVADYSVMILLTEIVRIHYTISIAAGGIIGAGVNFLASRYWAFKSDQPYISPANIQLIKFSCVVAGSIALKSSGTFLITENLHISYKISRLMVDGFVAYCFNFVLMKYWVFRNQYN